MLDAGSAVIDYHGLRHLAELIMMFENHLAGPLPMSEAADFIQEAVVILFGRVARHLDSSDPRLPTILARLVESLKTPSEQVQYAVADCLAPLVQVTRSFALQLANQLLDELFNAPKYASRRGAAYGLTGIVKGIGISAMKQFDVFQRLKGATEDKKQYEPRQGAMFALETLSSTLGRLFELTKGTIILARKQYNTTDLAKNKTFRRHIIVRYQEASSSVNYSHSPVNAAKHISELKFEVITLFFFLLDSTILYLCWPEIFKLWGFSIPW
jgi:hypothetical protein